MNLDDGLKKLAERRARALEMGGPDRLARQRALGKLNVRSPV